MGIGTPAVYIVNIQVGIYKTYLLGKGQVSTTISFNLSQIDPEHNYFFFKGIAVGLEDEPERRFFTCNDIEEVSIFS